MRVVLEHQALVDAGGGVAQHDLLAILALGKIAGREQVDAGDLELGRGHRAVKARLPRRTSVCGQHLAHFVERRNKAIAGPPMLGAFAQRKDAGSSVRIWSSTTMPRLTARPAALARPMAGRMPTAMTTMSQAMTVPSSSATPSTLLVAQDLLGIGLVITLMPRSVKRLFQQIAGGGIELALHQRRRDAAR